MNREPPKHLPEVAPTNGRLATPMRRAVNEPVFPTFFMGGFECSSHRRCDGVRLDLLASSGHAQHFRSDYANLVGLGIRSIRDGLRWHLIESEPNQYDWTSFVPMLRASREFGMQVVWDLCHYGWPDHLDIWAPSFIDSFAAFSGEFARIVWEETGKAPFVCPVNEMSFWAWAGGEVAQMNPCESRRGAELKRQLVRAAIASVDAVRHVCPESRFIYAEPAIYVDAGDRTPEHRRAAEAYRLAQFEVFDMISGRIAPELGGARAYLDIIGVNYYPDNQWYLGGSTIPLGHHAYRSFSDILLEISDRYGRPMIVAETGAEGRARPSWLHYIAAEVLEAIDRGAPIEAVCLYPVLDTPGWTNDRLCPVGLFSVADGHGHRTLYEPLARELARHQEHEIFSRGAPSRQRVDPRSTPE